MAYEGNPFRAGVREAGSDKSWHLLGSGGWEHCLGVVGIHQQKHGETYEYIVEGHNQEGPPPGWNKETEKS